MSERGWWEFNDSSFCCLFTTQLCWWWLVKQQTDEVEAILDGSLFQLLLYPNQSAIENHFLQPNLLKVRMLLNILLFQKRSGSLQPDTSCQLAANPSTINTSFFLHVLVILGNTPSSQTQGNVTLSAYHRCTRPRHPSRLPCYHCFYRYSLLCGALTKLQFKTLRLIYLPTCPELTTTASSMLRETEHSL